MSDLIAAELLKARTGRLALVTGVIAVLLGVTTCFGYASDGDVRIGTGAATAETVTNDMVRSWFTTLLLAAIFGAVFIAREYGHGTIARSVLAGRSRSRLFAAKIAAVGVVGLIFAAVAAVGALATTVIAARHYGIDLQWTTETTAVLIGVAAVTALAAPWGLLVGWIVRSPVAAVAAVMALTLVVDPALQRLAPGVANATMTIAMSAIYRDAKPDLLPIGAAWAVVAGWLVLAAVIAHRALIRRDVV